MLEPLDFKRKLSLFRATVFLSTVYFSLNVSPTSTQVVIKNLSAGDIIFSIE